MLLQHIQRSGKAMQHSIASNIPVVYLLLWVRAEAEVHADPLPGHPTFVAFLHASLWATTGRGWLSMAIYISYLTAIAFLPYCLAITGCLICEKQEQNKCSQRPTALGVQTCFHSVCDPAGLSAAAEDTCQPTSRSRPFCSNHWTPCALG